jgi:hypothetical protein
MTARACLAARRATDAGGPPGQPCGVTVLGNRAKEAGKPRFPALSGRPGDGSRISGSADSPLVDTSQRLSMVPGRHWTGSLANVFVEWRRSGGIHP